MSGIGLAYQTPEQRTAATLDAGARAVTQQPAAPGIGMATVTEPQAPVVDTSQAAAMPSLPAAAPEAPKEAPLIDFHENPLAAIGLVLQSVAAGYKGDASPVEALKASRAKQVAQEYQTAGLALDVIDKTSKYVMKYPASQRAAAIADLDARFSPALGGRPIAGFLTAITSGDQAHTEATLGALKELNVSPAMMSYFGANPEAAVGFLNEYNKHKASTETPEEAAARAKAIAVAQGEAGAVKPMTPAEIATDKRAREANSASNNNAQATRDAANSQRGTAQENNLRTSYEGQSKNFVVIRDAKQKIDSAAKAGGGDKTGAADQALIFSYMKLLDPTSTVREGEFATAQNSGGVGSAVQNAYNAALSGKLLTEQQRMDFAKQAGRIYSQAEKNHVSLVRDYRGKATRSGADPENVIIDYVGVPIIDSDAEFSKLPKGAEFIDPHGDRRRKP